MDFTAFQQVFDQVLNKEITTAPYDNPKKVEHVLLNQRRQERWLKQGKLLPELSEKIKQLKQKQQWVLITEPHCGDSAHTAPFIKLLSELNPLIDLEVQLRDSDSEIEQYLFQGTRSIPILIIRDEQGLDLGTWGPRPKNLILKRGEWLEQKMPHEELEIEIQQWYNRDKGESFQSELTEIFANIETK